MPETRGLPLEAIQDAFQQPILRNWPSMLRRRIVSQPASETASVNLSFGESAPIELRAMTPIHLGGT